MAKSQLTDRQQALFDRLVTLGKWAKDGELPVTILEIRGFGSFFRGKPRPHDVDLLVRIQRPEQRPEFVRFNELLEGIRYDSNLEDSFASPREALVALQAECDGRINDLADEDHRRFLNWIEPYSWKMLRPKSIPEELTLSGPENFAKRMVKKHLPNLNIFRFQNPGETRTRPTGLRCGFTVPIWSEEHSDTEANLAYVLSDEVVRQNLLRELSYFDIQLSRLQSQSRLLMAEIGLLQRIQRRRKESGNSWHWFEKWSKTQGELKAPRSEFELADKAAREYDEAEWDSPKAMLDESQSLSKTVSEADKRRKEIKHSHETIENLELVRNVLAHYKSGDAHTELSASQYVVDELLSDGSKRRKEKVASFLRQYGFPVGWHERRQRP